MAIDAKPVTVESSSTDILKSLTPAQMKTWRETGNLPDLPSKNGTPAKKAAAPKIEKTEPAESSTAAKETPDAEPAEKQDAAETPAESVPAKVEAPPKKPTSPAQARIKDLLAEVSTLRQENDNLQRQLKPVKETKAAQKPQRNDVDDKGQAKYASDEIFQDARDEWIRAEAIRTTREEIAKEAHDRQVMEIRTNQERRLDAQLKLAKERHADFDQKLMPKEIADKDGKKSIVYTAPGVKVLKTPGVVDAWILDSDLGVEILYHLADKPEEIERIQSLGAFAAARELTKLEQQLSSQPAKSGSKPAEEVVEEIVEEEPVKKVSSAPEPATSFSGKDTAPADKEEAALREGDFRTYQQVANEKDWRKKKAS